MRPLFLDVETTGTEEKDRLIQLSWKIRGEKFWFNSLYKPPVPVSIEAMSVCHITNEMLEIYPPFDGSLGKTQLQSEFNKEDIVFVAHNAQFDMSFLLKEGMVLPKNHICTYKLSHAWDKKAELGKNTLQYLRYYYNLQFDETINPHDAKSDVLVLEKLYEFYEKHFTLAEMIEISRKPILHKKFTFGKYKGEFYKDVAKKDLDYLLWCRRSATELDDNIKYSLEYYINSR